jgi:hypothetical protein
MAISELMLCRKREHKKELRRETRPNGSKNGAFYKCLVGIKTREQREHETFMQKIVADQEAAKRRAWRQASMFTKAAMLVKHYLRRP